MDEAMKREAPQVSTSALHRPDNVRLGMLLMIVSVFIAPMIDVFGKLAAATLPPAEISAFRFLLQTLLMLPLVLWRGSLWQIGWRQTRLHMIRGAILAVSMIAFVTALRAMALADAIAIFFVEPIILTILGGVFLKEKIGWRRYGACAVGFGGAMLIIRPSFEHLGWVALLPVVCAFGIAVFALMTRILAHREDPWSMQLQTGFWGGVFCLVVLLLGEGTGSSLFDPIWPDAAGLAKCFGVGLAASVSGMFAVYAYRDAPASTLAPLQYFEIVCATFFGWSVFGDFPDALTWLGIAIIIASGLFILWRERQLARRLASAAPLAKP